MPEKKQLKKDAIEMSEIAICNLPASARSKKAISEHAQEHAPGLSPAVLDKALQKSKELEKKEEPFRTKESLEKEDSWFVKQAKSLTGYLGKFPIKLSKGSKSTRANKK